MFEVQMLITLQDIYSISHRAIFLFYCNSKTNNSIVTSYLYHNMFILSLLFLYLITFLKYFDSFRVVYTEI